VKRALVFAVITAGLLGASWGAYRTVAPSEPELSRFIPSGPLLYLQAKNLNSLLSDWDKSAEKSTWLKSSNYEVFSRSRLFLRLKDAEGEFSSVAGVPADTNLLHQLAGEQSALALFDIGKLQFLYITRLPSAASIESALWQTRAKFETRSAGSVTFYYRHDPDSDREVAFAVTGDYLLLATREDLMAGALQLIAGGGKDHAMEQEPWWSRSISATGEAGDLRMVLNLEKIVPSPYFRSYWIQQNITDMKQYSAAICDLKRSSSEYLEQRTLWKKDAAAQAQSDTKGAGAVADLLRLVPAADTGIYEAKANPDAKESLALLETKILAPHLGPAATQKLAPEVQQLGSGETGSSSDLETRIDQPPVQNSPATESDSSAVLKDLLAKNHVLAELQLQGTARDSAGVFVRIHSTVVFVAESDWNENAVRVALVDFVRPAFTTGQLGVEWKSAQGYSQLDGLWPLSLAIHGKYLFVSDDPALLTSVLANMTQKPTATTAVLVAGFDHHRERQNFSALTRLLDRGQQQPANGRQPEFFSGNIASLSSMFKDVSSETVIVRDANDRQTQTVTYAWAH
jgi:hypothetical protein